MSRRSPEHPRIPDFRPPPHRRIHRVRPCQMNFCRRCNPRRQPTPWPRSKVCTGTLMRRHVGTACLLIAWRRASCHGELFDLALCVLEPRFGPVHAQQIKISRATVLGAIATASPPARAAMAVEADFLIALQYAIDSSWRKCPTEAVFRRTADRQLGYDPFRARQERQLLESPCGNWLCRGSAELDPKTFGSLVLAL
jgi:hypothetical protein